MISIFKKPMFGRKKITIGPGDERTDLAIKTAKLYRFALERKQLQHPLQQ